MWSKLWLLECFLDREFLTPDSFNQEHPSTLIWTKATDQYSFTIWVTKCQLLKALLWIKLSGNTPMQKNPSITGWFSLFVLDHVVLFLKLVLFSSRWRHINTWLIILLFWDVFPSDSVSDNFPDHVSCKMWDNWTFSISDTVSGQILPCIG